MRKVNKGAVGWNLFILVIFVGVLFFGTLDLTIDASFESAVSRTVDDLQHMIEARSTVDLYTYNHFPLAAEYAVHQASYELADDGGGVEWTSETVEDDANLDYRFGFTSDSLTLHPLYSDMYSNLREESQNIIDNDYSEELVETSACSLESTEYLLTFNQEVGDLEGSILSTETIESECRYADSEVVYRQGESFNSIPFRARDNRYLSLTEEALDIVTSINEEWSGVGSYEETRISCGGGYPTEEAHDAAVSEADSDVKSRFDDALDGYPLVDGFEIVEASIESSQSFSEGDNADYFEGSNDVDTSTSTCNCRTVDGEQVCDTEYTSEVTVTPELSEVLLELQDSEYRILTSDGWQHLSFKVDTYEHEFG